MDRKNVPHILAEKTLAKDMKLDPSGFFVIEVREKEIFVEYYSNVYRGDRIVSGQILKVFSGTRADALSDTIAHHVPDLRAEHFLYLGRELQKAEIALRNGTVYEQGGC